MPRQETPNRGAILHIDELLAAESAMDTSDFGVRNALAANAATPDPAVKTRWLSELQTTAIGSCSILLIVLASLFSPSAAVSDGKSKAERLAEYQQRRHIYRSRPRRIDEPLRAENVSDEEIREIQASTVTIYPGAIANVSGVTAGCPCEEGPMCDSQVWILAHRDDRYDGLMLSRISNKWVVGPLQTWWVEYDLLKKQLNELRSENPAGYRAAFREHHEKRMQLEEAFPVCAPEEESTP